ncbi:hypothetical protein Nizo1839_2393 [Lactiplantibacillus plantarum]|nr:hypothetical protein SF2A35B_0747 [Lactiplantibacillus plantarum]KZT78331.1 hypothetical protein Nizo1839_2393 [Lactiplantibacillus plantarum]
MSAIRIPSRLEVGVGRTNQAGLHLSEPFPAGLSWLSLILGIQQVLNKQASKT